MGFVADKAALVLDWIVQNKEWLFGGVGVAAVAGIFAIIKWMRARKRVGHSSGPQQTTGQQTGDITTTSGSVSFSHGLGGEEVAKIVESALAASDPRVGELTRDKEQLEAQLGEAVQRAADAEARGLPDSSGVLDELRTTGDTGGLLEFLVGPAQGLGGGLEVRITVTLLDAVLAFEARGGPGYTQCVIDGGNLVAEDSGGSPIEQIQTTAFTQVIRTATSSSVTF